MVILSKLTFTLINLNEYTWLVIGVCGEDLLFLGGDGSITGKEDGHDSTSGLYSEGEGSNVQ
jgi:hypothetical protein